MIGASMLSISRNRRILAQKRGSSHEAFAATRSLCKRDEASFATRTVVKIANHFRTPSPGGQVSCPHADLSANSISREAWRLPAQQQDSLSRDLHCVWKFPFVEHSSENGKKGKYPCRSNQNSWSWHVAADLPRAETQWDNRRLSAARSALVRQPSSAAVSRPVWPSEPRATCCSAKHTHRAADQAAYQRQKHQDAATYDLARGVFRHSCRVWNRPRVPCGQPDCRLPHVTTRADVTGTLTQFLKSKAPIRRHGPTTRSVLGSGHIHYSLKGTGHV